MKRLFMVVRNNGSPVRNFNEAGKLEVAYYEDKQQAKITRDGLNSEGRDCHVTYGPDHWRFNHNGGQNNG